MMNRIPQMASISDLKNHHLEILAKLEQGPVLLASRNQPTAVMISPELWNQIVDILEEYEDLVVIQERISEAAADSEVMRPISELRAKLQQDGLLDDDPK